MRSAARVFAAGLLGTVAVFAMTLASETPASADPATCQKTIVKKLLKFKKTYVGQHIKCLDAENKQKIMGPCPDALTDEKIQKVNIKVRDAIAEDCSMADLAALGFPGNCQLESGVSGVEADCAALPVTTPAELAECLKCWKAAELSEFVAILYASHALEVCGGDLSETSPVCSDLDCTTPLPDQRDLLNDGERDCQRGIGKAGLKYLVARERTLEKCALAGGTQASCLADTTVQASLANAALKRDVQIMKKCGNREPSVSPPFCCRTGMGNMCTVVATREDCETLDGQIQEGKICGGGGTCDPDPGPNKITWWEFCPEAATCPGTQLTSIDDVSACVGTSADAIADELLCFQIPRNGGADWPCPPPDGSPSGAFVDGLDATF